LAKTTALVSPRVGFNYDVFGDKSLQVRGGTGIFAGPPPFVWISNQASNNGVQFGARILTSGVPFNVNPDAYRPTAGAANTSYGINVTDNNFKNPTVLKSSLAIDKKFKGDWVVTIEGTHTRDLNAVYYSNINLNQNLAQATVMNGGSASSAVIGADQRVRYATATGSNRAVFYGAGGATVSNPNLTTAILMKNTTKGYSYTLTGRVQKHIKISFLAWHILMQKAKTQQSREVQQVVYGVVVLLKEILIQLT